MLEINPLIVTKQGQLRVLDAKVSFDDNALFRHPDVAALRDETEEDAKEIEASKYDLNYVALDGTIGCMVNGAGLAMATMDIIKLYGGEPANFLDVGGGATEEKVTAAFKIITADPNVKGILVNIFGGIMKCDIIAEGVIAAVKEVGLKVPLVVRLEGTNVELGKKIIRESGLNVIPADDLDDAAQKIVKAVKGRLTPWPKPSRRAVAAAESIASLRCLPANGTARRRSIPPRVCVRPPSSRAAHASTSTANLIQATRLMRDGKQICGPTASSSTTARTGPTCCSGKTIRSATTRPATGLRSPGRQVADPGARVAAREGRATSTSIVDDNTNTLDPLHARGRGRKIGLTARPSVWQANPRTFQRPRESIRIDVHPHRQEDQGHLPGLHRQERDVPFRSRDRLRHQDGRRHRAGQRRRTAPRTCRCSTPSGKRAQTTGADAQRDLRAAAGRGRCDLRGDRRRDPADRMHHRGHPGAGHGPGEARAVGLEVAAHRTRIARAS